MASDSVWLAVEKVWGEATDLGYKRDRNRMRIVCEKGVEPLVRVFDM